MSDEHDSFLNDEYLDRHVAFLDVLGFTDFTRRCLEEPELFLRMKACLEILKVQQVVHTDLKVPVGVIAKLRQHLFPPKTIPMDQIRCTAFSDSILVSAPAKTINPVWFFGTITNLWWSLAGLGLFIRGAIVRGWVAHAGDIVFGQALVDAYNLERCKARMPRVVVDESLVTNLDYSQKSWIAVDDDNSWCLNVFSVAPYIRNIEDVRKAVHLGLSHPCENVRAKHGWLLRKLSAS